MIREHLAVRALIEALGAERCKVAAVGSDLERAIAARGHVPTVLDPTSPTPVDTAAGFDALCTTTLPPDPVIGRLRDWMRVLRTGGTLWLAQPALLGGVQERKLVAAYFLHAGLVDISQRQRRGVLLTSGRAA